MKREQKVLVLYRSKYGSTKKYVDLLRQEISCDCCEIGSGQIDGIDRYDLIVVAGGIYAGGISGMKFLQRNLQVFSGKKLAVFAVGASPYDEAAFETVKQHNLRQIPIPIPMFYGRGAYDEERMDFKDRALCRLLRKSLKKRDPGTFEPWMEAFFEADGKSCDWTDPVYLRPLLAYIEGTC